ncbi:5'(3')-deoxyribonucleotidase, mitochondrial-like [Saccostrea echinata]|uniref:5'(3')-deoxyribonucleotidase, mitochondrial-like n=1 Tax=Saccostrea echinata TaxID=191078 RepID=UPI002A808F75|nr:5'(3')-deoxyribonucleotidase, mitochondrial-like [Saccostrea echinata]
MAGRRGVAALAQKKLLVLVDLDGVMADFEGHFLTKWKQKYPDEPFVALEDRRTFYLADQYETLKEGLKPMVKSVYESKGFFRDLPPIAGACSAVKEMNEMDGVEVFICSSPLFFYKYSAKEKFAWVEHYLGKNWINKIILTRDKTIVSGHVLIDDNVKIKGAVDPPSWEHIVFTAYYNKDMNLRGRRRLDNWTDGSWKDLILDFKRKL